jgi:hypothetical protein
MERRGREGFERKLCGLLANVETVVWRKVQDESRNHLTTLLFSANSAFVLKTSKHVYLT